MNRQLVVLSLRVMAFSLGRLSAQDVAPCGDMRAAAWLDAKALQAYLGPVPR